MKSVVVFESMYGNTRHIAEEIGHGLGVVSHVTLGTTRDVDFDDVLEADLIVVGGPTHVHGMLSNASRRGAVEEAEKEDIVLDPAVDAEVLRKWLKKIPTRDLRFAAAFDTRLDKSALLTGSAAKDIAKKLTRHGFTMLEEPESFFVDDSQGPLVDGEAHRARLWGETLALRCRDRLTPAP